MKASLSATQKLSRQTATSSTQQGTPITNVKIKKSTKSRPGLAITIQESKAPVINLDTSDVSDHTSSQSALGKVISTSRNNGDKGPRKSHSQQSSNASSSQPEAWKSRLFRQAIKRSQSSSSDVIVKMGTPLKAPTVISPKNTTTPVIEEDKSSSSTVAVNARDSFLLRHHQRKTEIPEEIEVLENIEVPCEALTLSRGGEKPVVYGKWFDFNDDIVTEVSCENFKHVFEGLECAYMLFYKRTGQHVH